jgi:hypothetical protein
VLRLGIARSLADIHHSVSNDANVPLKAWIPGAIDDPPVANENVILLREPRRERQSSK